LTHFVLLYNFLNVQVYITVIYQLLFNSGILMNVTGKRKIHPVSQNIIFDE